MTKNRGAAIGLLLMLGLAVYAMTQNFSSQPSSWLKEFWDWTTHDPVSFYTFTLAVFTGVLGCVSIIQIRFLTRADGTARIAADAAKKSADVAERALVAGRRAWLSIYDLRVVHPTRITEEGANIALGFTVKNLGETPATSVWVDAASAFIKSYLAASETFRIKMRAHVVAGIPGPIIFPNDAASIPRLMWFIDGEDVKRALRTQGTDGQKFLDFALFAATSYKIVGDDSPHLTFIPCDWLNIPVGLELGQGEVIDLGPAPFGQSIAD